MCCNNEFQVLKTCGKVLGALTMHACVVEDCVHFNVENDFFFLLQSSRTHGYLKTAVYLNFEWQVASWV